MILILFPNKGIHKNTNYSASRLCLIRRKTATITGVEIITKASKMFGLVIWGKMMLPYFMIAAPARDPAPSFNR